MRLHSFVLASFFVAAAALDAGNVRAQATTPTYTFDAVSQFGAQGNTFWITGVQHGASAASTIQVTGIETSGGTVAYAEACERALLVAMNRPGRFSVGVYANSGILNGCLLTQLP
jgi:hypothetical protein